MSQTNLWAIERVYERVTASLEMPPELFDADLVLDAREVAPDFDVVKGLAAAQAQFRVRMSLHGDRASALKAVGLEE